MGDTVANSIIENMTTENLKREFWLNYFNEVLFKEKIISLEEMKQIENLINKECCIEQTNE